MKTRSAALTLKYLGFLLTPLVAIGLWWASGSRAETIPVAAGAVDSRCIVYDKRTDIAIDLKLLLHRPGWASPSVVTDGSS